MRNNPKYSDKDVKQAAKLARDLMRKAYPSGVRGLSKTDTHQLINTGINMVLSEIIGFTNARDSGELV